jgi:small conductance mechanosensitive channel
MRCEPERATNLPWSPLPGMMQRMSPSFRRTALLMLALLVAPQVIHAQDQPIPVVPEDSGSTDATAEAAPAPEPSAEQLLSARIHAAYAVVGGLDGVDVEAREGVLLLSGAVSSNASRELAELLAGRAGDGYIVINRVEVRVPDESAEEAEADDPDHAVEGRIRSVFAEVVELRGLEVRVRSGIVRLSGIAPSDEALTRAREFAEGVPGVIYVDVRATVDQELDGRVAATWARLRSRGNALLARGPLYLAALTIVLLGLVFGRIVRQPSEERRLPRTPLLKHLARQVFATLLIIGAVMLAMDLLGATGLISAALGTAGVMGLALGFALKDIIENYLASVLLAVRHPFAPDEQVRVGSHEGKVVRLTARDTVLMTVDGNHLRISNAEVYKSPITNYTRNPLRRFCFDIKVRREHELGLVKERIHAALEMDGVLADPRVQLRVEQIDSYSSTLSVAGWVDQRSNDYFKVRSEALRRTRLVLDALDAPEHAPSSVAPALTAPLHDTTPDDALNAQVEEERRVTDERDLLKP